MKTLILDIFYYILPFTTKLRFYITNLQIFTNIYKFLLFLRFPFSKLNFTPYMSSPENKYMPTLYMSQPNKVFKNINPQALLQGFNEQ